MSSSPESRLRKVIKRPGSVTPTSPKLAEHPCAAAPLPSGEGDRTPQWHLEQAHRAGYEDGKRAGFAEAMAEIEARRVDRVERLCLELAMAATEAASARSSILDEVVGDVASLTPEIVEALVGEIEWPETPVHAALRRALALVPEGPHLVVRLHPGAALGADEIATLASRVGDVQVLLDPSVEQGGCVVEAGSCMVDGQLSSALERVRRQFRGLAPVSKGDS